MFPPGSAELPLDTDSLDRYRVGDLVARETRLRFAALAELSPEERLREALELSDLVAALTEAGTNDRANTEDQTLDSRPAPLRR